MLGVFVRTPLRLLGELLRSLNWHNPMCDSTLTCYNSGIDTEETLPNKHLDHLEDLIFVGRKEALEAVRTALSKPKLSVKWDGAPAIVFGTNPANGKFFVGTKSVFNKVKVKICYSQADIDKHYKGNVANILRLCFYHLPRLSGIIHFRLYRCRRGVCISS